jgi:hypothetical protein
MELTDWIAYEKQPSVLTGTITTPHLKLMMQSLLFDVIPIPAGSRLLNHSRMMFVFSKRKVITIDQG